MTDLVQKIREALAKITPWPWLYTPAHTAKYGKKWRGMVGNKDAIGQVGIIDNRENGNFVAHAPQWLSEAAEEIERLNRDIEKYKDQLDHYTNLDVPPVPDLRFSVRLDEEETP